jgi:hypothetical protein
VVSEGFETLCDKEFRLLENQAYANLDRQLVEIREDCAKRGLSVSSSRGQVVMDAVLIRFEKILDALEHTYLDKFSDITKRIDDSDFDWLKIIVERKMVLAVAEIRRRVQSELWEPSRAMVAYWERAEIEARKRCQKIRDKIEILQLRRKENLMQDTQESVGYRPISRSLDVIPHPLVASAKELFAGQTGLSGPQMFDFFSNYSETIAKMRYGSGVPSRKEIFENFLESLPVDKQQEALLALCDDYPMKTPPEPGAVLALREKLSGVPVPANLGKAVENIDVTYVSKQWRKLSDRLIDDPDGAITSARSLLESVCLYILDCIGKKFDHAGDLPALYRATAHELQLVPRKEDEESIRQILGSCSGITQGVAALRNQFGDAHGRLGEGAERRLAHLAANAVGTLCTFLIESFESIKKAKTSAVGVRN